MASHLLHLSTLVWPGSVSAHSAVSLLYPLTELFFRFFIIQQKAHIPHSGDSNISGCNAVLKKKHCFYSPYPIPIDIFGNRFTCTAHSLHFLTRCGCVLLPEQNSMNTTRHVIMLFYTLWRPFVLFRSLYTVVCCFFVCSRGHGGWAEPWRLYTAHLTNGPALCTCSC